MYDGVITYIEGYMTAVTYNITRLDFGKTYFISHTS